MTERLLSVGEVDLCVETFGSPSDPTILLIHGACASMLWWPRAFCAALAARGRHVVRYDSRDTGRSTHYPPGRPPYSLRDLADDAVGLLDALAVPAAHVVGRSMGGGVAMVAALDHPERVATLTLVGTTTGADDLPPTSTAFLSRPTADDPVDDIVLLMRAFAGPSPYFDADATRRLADPVRQRVHGRAPADAIPGATLLVLPHTGHDLPPQHIGLVVDALVTHTS